MIFQQIPGVRRLSSNVIVGALAIVSFDTINPKPVFSGLIEEFPTLIPNFDKLISGAGSTAEQSFYAAAFGALSWLLGTMLLRSAEFRSFAYLGDKKTAVKCLTQSEIEWTRLQKLIIKPLFDVPVRENLFEDVAVAMSKNGFVPPASNDWSDADYRRCFEIASFVADKSKRLVKSLKEWSELSDVMFVVGLILIASGFARAVTMILPSALGLTSFLLLFGNVFKGLVLIRFGTWSWRLSSYLEVRQADQLLSWFILKSTKTKSSRPRARKKNDTLEGPDAAR
jgi:hypothetical protein